MEAFSPDVYLSSTLSFVSIRAAQSSGLIACAKHYFLYEQEPVCDGGLDGEGGRTGCEDVRSMVDGGCKFLGLADGRQGRQGGIFA